MSLNLLIGGAVVACTQVGTQATSKTNVPFFGRIRVVTATTGSGGSINSFGHVITQGSSAGVLTTAYETIANGTSTGSQTPGTPPTVNLTGTLTIDFQCNYAGAVSGNAITLAIFSVKLVS